jgi:hypothetical protein
MRFFRDFIKHASKSLGVKQQIEDKFEIMKAQNKNDFLTNERTEIQLQLMKMNCVCVTKVACSNTHSLVVSPFVSESLVYKYWSRVHLGTKRIQLTRLPDKK